MLLADTSFLIDVLRGHPPAVELLEALERRGVTVRVPTVALFELHRGLSGATVPDEERHRIETVVGSRPLRDLDSEAARRGGDIDGRLVREGTPIDPEDAMIAGTALAHGDPVLTRNRRHFGLVPGLTVHSYG